MRGFIITLLVLGVIGLAKATIKTAPLRMAAKGGHYTSSSTGVRATAEACKSYTNIGHWDDDVVAHCKGLHGVSLAHVSFEKFMDRRFDLNGERDAKYEKYKECAKVWGHDKCKGWMPLDTNWTAF